MAAHFCGGVELERHGQFDQVDRMSGKMAKALGGAVMSETPRSPWTAMAKPAPAGQFLSKAA